LSLSTIGCLHLYFRKTSSRRRDKLYILFSIVCPFFSLTERRKSTRYQTVIAREAPLGYLLKFN